MGKFSKPRGDSFNEPESDLELETTLDPEPEQDADEFSTFEDFSDIPMDELAQPTAAPAYAEQSKSPKKRKVLLIILCIAIVIFLVSVIACLWLSGDSLFGNGQILENVTVAGVDVSGMTKEEAVAAVAESGEQTILEDMVIELPDTTLTLSASDAVALNAEAAVDDAYQYGRSGSWSENRKVKENAPNTSYDVDLTDYLIMNTEYIQNELNAYCTGYNSDFVQSSLTVEGEQPVLDTADENFDPDAPCQTIILSMGTPGRYIDAEAFYQQVMDAYDQRDFQITVTGTTEETLPEDLTEQLTQLHELNAVEPVDSAYDRETQAPTCEVYGYTFDLEAALLLIEEADYNETVEVQFTLVLPERTKETVEAMLFRDELASYETKHTNNSNRNANLKLACAAINNMVLLPGEQFDYNKALGKRTAEAGYKAADAYSGGQTVQTIGGGICQVSSTLYYCTLLADLQIDNRTAHSYTSSYMPLGMDATVSWGGPEFRFTNNTNYPIRIEAEVSGGYVKIKLIGTDEKDYYVKMEYEVLSNTYATTITEEYTKDNAKGYKDGQVIQTAYNGCDVQSYKCKYNKETNELISREKEALSKYKKRDKIVVKIVSPVQETTPPTGAATPTEATPSETTA